MSERKPYEPPIQAGPLSVTIVDGEIVLDHLRTTAPSLTVAAARETARRLIDAADQMDRAIKRH